MMTKAQGYERVKLAHKIMAEAERPDTARANLLRQATGLLRKSLPQPNCPSRPLQHRISSYRRKTNNASQYTCNTCPK